MIASIEDLDAYDAHDYVDYVCQDCGKVIHKQVRSILARPQLLCRSCLVKAHTSEETKQATREKRRQTCLVKYGVASNLCTPEQIEKTKANMIAKYGVCRNVEKTKQTKLERYGFTTHFNSPEVREQQRQNRAKQSSERLEKARILKEEKQKLREIMKMIRLLKQRMRQLTPRKHRLYEATGYSPFSRPEVRAKAMTTFNERYGTANYMQTETFQEKRRAFWATPHPDLSEQTSVRMRLAWTDPDFIRKATAKHGASSFEGQLMTRLSRFGLAPSTRRITYELRGETRTYLPDYEWNGYVFEAKGDHLLHQWDPERTKLKLAKADGVFFYSDMHWMKNDLKYDFIALLEQCLETPFSNVANAKLAWSDYYTYRCYVGDKSSPYDAWSDPKLLWKAVQEVRKSFERDSSWHDGYIEAVLRDPVKAVFRKLTVAKIAPRVTLFSSSMMKRAIQEFIPEAIRIGVYDPCAGFGGRKEGCDFLSIAYEGYDVNATLIDHFGWTYRDAWNTPVETTKAVITSTPYNCLENWPSIVPMIDASQDEWIDRLVAMIDAPLYGFFVRETKRDFIQISPAKKGPGLFAADQKLVIIKK